VLIQDLAVLILRYIVKAINNALNLGTDRFHSRPRTSILKYRST